LNGEHREKYPSSCANRAAVCDDFVGRLSLRRAGALFVWEPRLNLYHADSLSASAAADLPDLGRLDNDGQRPMDRVALDGSNVQLSAAAAGLRAGLQRGKSSHVDRQLVDATRLCSEFLAAESGKHLFVNCCGVYRR
jgi:hypothetical protein